MEKKIEQKYAQNVDLQTKVYDMINRRDADKALYENKIHALQCEITKLTNDRKGRDAQNQVRHLNYFFTFFFNFLIATHRKNFR